MADFFLGSFEQLKTPWQQILDRSRHKLLFSSSSWSEIWWEHFKDDSQLFLGAFREDKEIIGIAPFRLNGDKLYFIGSDDVCDFQDFIIEPDREKLFFNSLYKYLIAQKDITEINLSPLLPDSTAMHDLRQLEFSDEWQISSEEYDIVVAVDLPDTLDEYLKSLSSKQRHEILRKERRLYEEGDVQYQTYDQPDKQDIDIFFKFFKESREDKKNFLSQKMESFFRSVIAAMAEQKILSLGMLKLNSIPVACTLCFTHNEDTYLYNSGYDPAYRWLSVGLLSKYICVKDSIEKKRKRFDFLKGDEQYKFHLGGKGIPIYRVIIKQP